jgi:hypothetical protein
LHLQNLVAAAAPRTFDLASVAAHTQAAQANPIDLAASLVLQERAIHVAAE